MQLLFLDDNAQNAIFQNPVFIKIGMVDLYHFYGVIVVEYISV